MWEGEIINLTLDISIEFTFGTIAFVNQVTVKNA